MSDYATRYPEAVPVKAIDAEHIAEELVKIFARVGIPEEILTDQGSNFTSQLLAEMYQLLHTDGLVERFNKTLKDMLQKVAADDEANWDKRVPYLLFAYREVPQDSTGFSPFDLLYGRSVRGPLDILKESWKEPKRCSENVVSYVLGVQDKLATMSEMVKDNLERAQQKQKLWYNQNARQKELKPGDLVLVLLPTSGSFLTAQWKGPYPVLHRASSVNYVVDMHDTRKRERTFHIKMEYPDICEKGDPTVGKQLSEVQKSQLNRLLGKFLDVMSSIPGRTTEAEHQVTTTGARPVRLPPYQLPHAYRDMVEKEIKEMLDAGVMEPEFIKPHSWVLAVMSDAFWPSGGPQRLMYKVLQGLEDYAAAYIDDLVIHSATWEEHLTQIQTVFQRLRSAGLTAKPQKCQLGTSRCVHLGYVVGSGLVQPERIKVQGVEAFPTPTTKKQVW
ncbi:hypothetical protein EMCRGX_G013874 [Ephydatia muelleri]